MNFDLSKLEEAHRSLDAFVSDEKLYKEAVKRSKRKAISIVHARQLLKRAIEVLGDDEVYDIIARLEVDFDTPPGKDIQLSRISNEEMEFELETSPEDLIQVSYFFDAFFSFVEG